jgi:hypothetical protein
MKGIKHYFRSMSFKKQLILVFIATTVMTLIVSIVIIKVQVDTVKDETNSDLLDVNYGDYRSSTSLTALTIKSGILSYIFTLSQLLQQISTTYDYFQTNNPNSYISNETNYPLKLTSQFGATPDYTMPAQYQYANNGLSYAEFSFFDVLMPQLLSMTREIIKRLNILFINPSKITSPLAIQTHFRSY